MKICQILKKIMWNYEMDSNIPSRFSLKHNLSFNKFH